MKSLQKVNAAFLGMESNEVKQTYALVEYGRNGYDGRV